MPLPDGKIGLRSNPLQKNPVEFTPLVQNNDDQSVRPPFNTNFMITEVGEFMITQSNDYMITE